MKILLVVAAILISVTANPDDEAANKRQTKVINDARRAYAKEHNIANMHELELTYLLIKVSDELAVGCPDKATMKTKTVFEAVPVHQVNRVQNSHYDAEVTEITKTYLWNPVQTMYAVGDKVLSYCGYEHIYNAIYVLGPGKKKIVKHGTPGSECNWAYYVNKDGLCVKKKA